MTIITKPEAAGRALKLISCQSEIFDGIGVTFLEWGMGVLEAIRGQNILKNLSSLDKFFFILIGNVTLKQQFSTSK